MTRPERDFERDRDRDFDSAPTLKRIKVEIGPITFRAVLNETDTARAIYEALPLEGTAQIWGPKKEEVYFAIPVEHEEEETREYADPGDLAYWSPGQALCIFLGAPVLVDATNDDRPTRSVQEPDEGNMFRPASPVNIIGQIEGDMPPDIMMIGEGDPIRVTALT